MNPLDVTVVIPVHDRADAVAAAVRSALDQTLPPRRVIVVDDGSSDDSAAAAEAVGAVVLRHERSRGSGAARNTAIAAADTTWIAFLDSDDLWKPAHLETVSAALPGHAFVTAPMVDSFGRGRGNVSGRQRLVTPERLFFPENIVCTSTVVARTDLIREVGGFSDLPRAQDLDLWIRLLGRGPASAVAEPTAVYSIPQQYQESALRTRSVRGAEQVRTRYADEPWMTPRLARGIDAQLAWDDLRHAQHHRDARGVLASARRLGRSPRAAGLLPEMLLHRRRARRFQPGGAV